MWCNVLYGIDRDANSWNYYTESTSEELWLYAEGLYLKTEFTYNTLSAVEYFLMQKEFCVISPSAWLRTLCSTNVWPLAEIREANTTVLRVKYSSHFQDKALCLPPRKDSKAPTVAQISEQIGSRCWMRATAYLMRRTQPHFYSPEQESRLGRGKGASERFNTDLAG